MNEKGTRITKTESTRTIDVFEKVTQGLQDVSPSMKDVFRSRFQIEIYGFFLSFRKKLLTK